MLSLDGIQQFWSGVMHDLTSRKCGHIIHCSEMCSLQYLNKSTCLLQKVDQNTDFRKNSEFQVALIGQRAQLDKCTNHSNIYILLALFILLSPSFPHLFLPKSPKSLPFHLWFLPGIPWLLSQPKMLFLCIPSRVPSQGTDPS